MSQKVRTPLMYFKGNFIMRIFCILFVIFKVTSSMYAKAGFDEAYNGLSEYFSEVRLDTNVLPSGGRVIKAVIIDPKRFQTGCFYQSAMELIASEEPSEEQSIIAEHTEGNTGKKKIFGFLKICENHSKNNFHYDLEACGNHSKNKFHYDLKACENHSMMKFFYDVGLDNSCTLYYSNEYVKRLTDKKFPGLKDNILSWLVILLEEKLKEPKDAKISLGSIVSATVPAS